jgi:hypothetical protein
MRQDARRLAWPLLMLPLCCICCLCLQEFPDVERMHRSKQLSKMAEKGLWGVSRASTDGSRGAC